MQGCVEVRMVHVPRSEEGGQGSERLLSNSQELMWLGWGQQSMMWVQYSHASMGSQEAAGPPYPNLSHCDWNGSRS